MRKGARASGAIALLVAIWWLTFYGWPKYLHFKRISAMSRARAYLVAGDLASASVSARQALQINPVDLEACRFMADLSERTRSATAIDWRRRVVDLEPAVSNELALVGAALRFERPPFPLAALTLKRVEPLGRNLPEFHVFSALLDLRLDQPGAALGHFQRAAALDPNNVVHQLNCAVLELQSPDPSVAQLAREVLERLSRNDRFQALALRSLVADQLRKGDRTGAQRFSERLLQLPLFCLDDHLAHLNILQVLENATRVVPQAAAATQSAGQTRLLPVGAPEVSLAGRFQDHLRLVQEHAAASPLEAYALCEWMGAHGLAEQGIQWLNNLPANFCNAQPVPLARANLYVVEGDWKSLESLLNSGRWGDMEFLRLALQARAAWGQNRGKSGDTLWRSAVRNASDRLGASMLLLRLSEDWARTPEEVLWTIWRRFPRENWAVAKLQQYYFATGNTRGLNRIYDARLEETSRSDDVTNRNDFACTSLLLGLHLPRAHTIARQLHEQKPDDLIIASTYAYSLYIQGKTNEALAVFSRFEPKTLEEPAVALYYGVLLANVGDTASAKRYLSHAKLLRLSPEEFQLLQQAQALVE